MVRQKPKGGCIHKLENRERCGRKIDGQGAVLYCSECRDDAQNEAKRERDRQRSADRRKDDREGDNFYHFLYYHKLTEPQLRPFLDNAEIPEEEKNCKADLCEYSVDELNETIDLLLDSTDVTSTAPTARKKVEALYCKVLHDSSPNRMNERLIAYVLEPLRDIGHVVTLATLPVTFRDIGRMAKEVREMWRTQGMLPHLILALFVEVERYRLQYMANPTLIRLWEKAYVRLLAAEYVCTRDLYKDEQKNLAVFLDFYAQYGFMRLWLDRDDPKRAEKMISTVKISADKAKQNWGTSPVTQIVSYLSPLAQAECYVHNDADKAYGSIKEADQALGDRKCYLIDEDATIPYLMARWALAAGSPDSEFYVHEYVNLCKRIPFLSYIYYLSKLEELTSTEISAEALLSIKGVFVETLFRYLSPFFRPKL